MATLAELEARVISLRAEIARLEASSGPPNGGLQASGDQLSLLAGMLNRAGVSLRAASGRTKTPEELNAELSRSGVPTQRRLELRIAIDRAAVGLPF